MARAGGREEKRGRGGEGGREGRGRKGEKAGERDLGHSSLLTLRGTKVTQEEQMNPHMG